MLTDDDLRKMSPEDVKRLKRYYRKADRRLAIAINLPVLLLLGFVQWFGSEWSAAIRPYVLIGSLATLAIVALWFKSRGVLALNNPDPKAWF
ncbi:MAG TPA: hypothetical protein VEA69_11385 [Tepidisphaeraceae bacterium]|nr:hypothetical protein [Tepidisphaeraceae bacterium]